MAKIIVKGWKTGFRKIDCTKKLQEYCSFGLKDAKQITDLILDHNEYELTIDDNKLSEFIKEIESIGLIVERVSTI